MKTVGLLGKCRRPRRVVRNQLDGRVRRGRHAWRAMCSLSTEPCGRQCEGHRGSGRGQRLGDGVEVSHHELTNGAANHSNCRSSMRPRMLRMTVPITFCTPAKPRAADCCTTKFAFVALSDCRKYSSMPLSVSSRTSSMSSEEQAVAFSAFSTATRTSSVFARNSCEWWKRRKGFGDRLAGLLGCTFDRGGCGAFHWGWHGSGDVVEKRRSYATPKPPLADLRRGCAMRCLTFAFSREPRHRVACRPHREIRHRSTMERIQFVPVAAKTREVRRDGLRQRRRLRKAGECAKAGERRLVPSEAMHPVGIVKCIFRQPLRL